MIKLARNITVAIALTVSSAALAQDTAWSISETDGQITVIRDGKSLYGAEGTKLKLGDVVRASKAARAVLVRGSDVAILSPNRQIRIAKPAKKGAVAQALDFIGDLIKPDTSMRGYNRPAQAAVVKGFGDGSEESKSGEYELMDDMPAGQ